MTVEAVQAQSSATASNAAATLGRGDIATTLSGLSGAINSVTATCNANSQAQVLAYVNNLIAEMNAPFLANFTSDLQNARSAISASNCNNIGTALTALSGVVSNISTVLQSPAAYPFDFMLSPNSAVAQPNQTSTLTVVLRNTSTSTNTYTLALGSVPAGVTANLNTTSVTLGPGASIAPGSATVTVTPTAATAAAIDLTASINGIANSARTIEATLTARSEFIKIQDVTPSNANVQAGTPVDVVVRVANEVNQPRTVQANLILKDSGGNTVATPAPQTAALSVQNSLTSITIAQVSTTGLPNGYFTLSVTLVDPQTGQPIPGGSGSGTLLIGSPVKASFTVTPQTVPPGNSQVFTSLNLSTLSGGTQGGAPYSLLAQVNTPSAAQSVAINGNLLYVCDNSEVLVYDVSNPSSPVKLSTALAGTINNSGNINCEVRNGKLLAVADTTSSTLGNNASFVAFDLTNPQQPSLVADTAINKRFMQQPLYIGNTAFIPTNAIYFYGNQRPFQELGDLVSLDVTNVAAPAIVGTLEKTSPDPVYGGSTPIFQGSAADPQTVYLGATSTAGTNIDNGNGQVWVVDVTNPAATSILKKIDIAGTIQTTAPIIQGNVAVAQSNTGGWNVVAANTPGTRGNIVFTVLDITNHRSPAITGTITTTLVPGTGGGSGAIGPNLFLFGGVRDASNKPVLAVVDTTDPARPVLTTYPVAFEPTRFRIVGNVLYATSGTNGLTIYSIPGTGSITYTAHVKIPNTGKLIYNPNSFNIQPTSIVPAASYDLVTWQNPASTTLSWTSTITGIVPGEVIAAALDSTVDYSVAQGSGTSAVSGVNVNSAQILGLNPANQTVTPGQQATYSLALSNPTGSTVTYNLAVIGVPQSWVTLPPTIAVAPNTTATLSLLLRSAIADIAGTYGFTVTATSGGTSGSVSGTLVLQGTGTVGTAIPNPGGVAVVLSPAQQTTGQGMTANYLVQLTPVGTPASSYTLTAQAPAGVTATFDQTTLPFAAGSPNIPQTVLHLTVAKGTAPAALSFAVTAAESSNQALTGQAAGTLNVVSSGVTLAFSSASASPNSTLQLQVTNTGTAGDTFNLTLGAPAGLASTLAKTSVTLAPGQSQNVGVNVGAMSFATLGNVLLTAQVTPQSNPAIAAQASAQVVIPATQGVAASFAPAVQATATPGAVPFLLKVQNTGTIEDAYIATIIATTGSVQASFADASGNLVQTTSLFRIPGVSAGTLLLNTMSTASSGGTVTVKITSQTNPSVAASAVATVRIGALGGPVANAGKNQSVAAGKYVLLDGCASYDPAGGRLSYRWALLSSPGGSAATLANSTAPSPALLPDVAGRYQLQLVVNNGTADSTPATVTVTAISNGNIPPTADAGPAKNALTGSPVTLDGNGSFDPDNGPQPLTYAWKFAQVPQGSTRSGNLVSTGATASFTPDVSGAFIITLTVSDGSATSSDSVTVTASASNVAPNANAGRTRRVLVNSPVALDASASNDPDNGPQPLTYAWQLVSGPLNSSVIQNPSAQKTTFTPATAAQYVARVDVSDGQASSEAQVGIIAGNTCDGNGDGVVNQIDFDLITALFGRAALPNDPLDANGDGVIDGRDLSICSSQLKPEVPTIFVDPPAVNFVFQKGRPLPAGQTVNVTGDSFTSFVIANLFNSQWLTWTVNNPATPAKVTISVSPAGLAAGVYDGQLAFGGPSINAAVLKIRLTVYDPSVLVALPSSLTFTAQSGAAEPLEQLLYVTAQGKQVGAASAVPSATWLEVEPNLGPTPINFRVLAHPGQLAPGSYTATITISADSTSPLIVPVTLIVL